MALEGRTNEIKGYMIATSVFDRKETFNQTTDPVVSVEARRLKQHIVILMVSLIRPYDSRDKAICTCRVHE